MNKIFSTIDTLIITGGLYPKKTIFDSFFPQLPSLIICADSGLDQALKWNISPHFIVGDFDSLKSKVYLQNFQESQLIRHKTEKDKADTELALHFAFEKKAQNIALVGGTGKRSDHFLENLNLFYKNIHPKVWLTPYEVIIPFDDSIIIPNNKNKPVSFFPLQVPAQIESYGLKWELTNLEWGDHFMSLSNSVCGKEATVSIKQGKLMLFYNL